MKNKLILFSLLFLGAGMQAQTNVFPASGNVGIGTLSPQHKLDVYGNIGANGAPVVSSDANYNWIYDRAGNQSIFLGNGANGIQANYYRNTSHLFQSIGGATTYLTVASSGNVGIGTTSPNRKLEVYGGAIRVSDAAGSYDIRSLSATQMGFIPTTDATTNYVFVTKWSDTRAGQARLCVYGPGTANWNKYLILTHDGSGGIVDAIGGNLRLNVQGANVVTLTPAGNVGIGTSAPDTKLAVNGVVHAKEVIVDTSSAAWSDYIFAPDYRLAPLSEVEQHIKAEQHLPGIPSAAEVAEHGISVGEMQAKLLAKVEELTLHQIALSKENAELRRRVEQLETASKIP